MNKGICILYLIYGAVWIGLGFTVFTPILSCIKGIFLYAYPGYLCLRDMESENRMNIGIGLAAVSIALTMLSFLFYEPLYSGTVLPVLFLAILIRQKRRLKERNEVAGIIPEGEIDE